MEVKTLALHKTNAMVQPGNAIEETDEDFPFKASIKLFHRMYRLVKLILENHSIRPEIPTREVIRIEDIVSKKSQL